MDPTSDVLPVSENFGTSTADFGTLQLFASSETNPSLPDAGNYGFAPAEQLLPEPGEPAYDTVAGTDTPVPPAQADGETKGAISISDVPYNGKNYTVTASPDTKRVEIFEQHPDGSLTPAEGLERADRKAILNLAQDKRLRDKAAAFLQNAQITPEEKENLAKLASLADNFDADVFAAVVESYHGRPVELQRLIKLANADAIVNDRNISFEAKYDEVTDDVTVAFRQDGYGVYEENAAPGPINVI